MAHKNKSKSDCKKDNDCRWNLMYYLSCFSEVSNFNEKHPEWRKYTYLDNYKSLTIEEQEELYHICVDEVNNIIADLTGFVEVPELDYEWINFFYKADRAKEVLWDKYSKRVTFISDYVTKYSRIMLYTETWMDHYYRQSLDQLAFEIDNEKHNRERLEKREKDWHKWVKLAGIIIFVVEFTLTIINLILASTMNRFKKWVIHVQIISYFLLCLELLIIPIVGLCVIDTTFAAGIIVMIFMSSVYNFFMKCGFGVQIGCTCICCGLCNTHYHREVKI